MCKVTISDFYCTCCGEKTIPIARKEGQQRGAGHLKRLFCLKCQAEKNCVEIKPFGSYTKINFLEEFLGENFDKDGNRILPYGLFKNQKVKDKLWNEIHNKALELE